MCVLRRPVSPVLTSSSAASNLSEGVQSFHRSYRENPVMVSKTTEAGALMVTVPPDVKRTVPAGCDGVAVGSVNNVADMTEDACLCI